MHCFADDTQLYLSFKPDDNTSQIEAISAMNRCIDDLRNWMIKQRLMINDDKTEFLLTGTRKQLAKINTACSITVGEYDIDPSRDLVRCVQAPLPRRFAPRCRRFATDKFAALL